MANTQTIIFTPVPLGLQLKPDSIKVSVVVTPRLRGDDTLGQYPDWVRWVELRKDEGLTVTFECAGVSLDVPVDTTRLRVDLWRGLFNDETYVRSYEYDDYTGEFVSSYSNRAALGLIKAVYQTAGVDFAEPGSDGDPRESVYRRRSQFNRLIEGFALAWNEDNGRSLRAQQKQSQQRAQELLRAVSDSPLTQTGIDQSGLIATGQLHPGQAGFADVQSAVAADWGVFTHQPQGEHVSRERLDDAHIIDFHQALSSLAPYREMRRDLGLVFDVELPLGFVARTTLGQPGALSITAVNAHWNNKVATTVPRTTTAYMNVDIDGERVFAVAPLGMLGQPNRPAVIGMLNLDRRWFGVDQVDVDGAMAKSVMHADNVTVLQGESAPLHPEVFDPTTTLSALRSGGLSLFADSRALTMLDTFDRSKQHSADLEAGGPQQTPFCAEDLTRGYRLDIWDSVTKHWHSVHERSLDLVVGDDGIELQYNEDEGYFQAALTRIAPDADGNRPNNDLYLHEAITRWTGWSLSAPTVGHHLTRSGDPAQAMPDPAHPDPENEAITPFKVTSSAKHIAGSLPRLRFGSGYRLRLRQVDIAGNGLTHDDPVCDLLTPVFSMPRGEGVIPYLRFEPVRPPAVVLRELLGVTGRGSAADRLVLRSFNSDPTLDTAAADLTASDRHIAPPGVHVEMAERHGMLDGPNGRINPSPAMWQLVVDRDKGKFAEVPAPELKPDAMVPVEPAERIAALPYLPDPLARAAAFRNLPGSSGNSIGRVEPGAGAAGAVTYTPLDDPQPRSGAVTIVEFGGRNDWQNVLPFRLALADGAGAPTWDPAKSLLTVSMPKGTTSVVPLSSCCDADDLKYLGVWAWLREYIDYVTVHAPDDEFGLTSARKDRIAHVLQLAVEGGHGMLTPPHLLTLVHAVQQPIGVPAFTRLTGQFDLESTDLRTQPEAAPTAGTELDVLTSWRTNGSTDAYLVGALGVHAASTAKVDIHATWTDPFDDLVADPTTRSFSAVADEVPISALNEGVLHTNGDHRPVGYYDPEHDLVALAPAGTQLGNLSSGEQVWPDCAPRHQFGDTLHRVVSYSAVATSRYREYFDPNDGVDAHGNAVARDFTRTSEPVEVHVPASARPVAPRIRYVLPTFGWERAASANQVRSVRTGGGLRVYLDRPWYSSGVGELLGVTLVEAGTLVDREDWKGLITQWGQDPIWESTPLSEFPTISNFPDAVASEGGLPLDAHVHLTLPEVTADFPRLADVAGHEVHYDESRGLYYCDLTVDTQTTTYSPFIRLALARYQPWALVEAKLSRVVLADFVQLTPERALTVTADPFVPGVVEVAVSGPAATGPAPSFLGTPVADRPTSITVSVQEQEQAVDSDLAWAPSSDFDVVAGQRDPAKPPPEFILWNGSVRYRGVGAVEPGRYRLLIEEHELYEVDGSHISRQVETAHGEVHREIDFLPPPTATRLIYAETVPLDTALLLPPDPVAATTTLE